MKRYTITASLLLFAALSCPVVQAQVQSDADKAIIIQANGGDAAARNTVAGWIFEGTHGQEQNSEKAYKLWAAAAQDNHPEAIANLGKCYENGMGTAKNVDTAYNLYEKAAKLGNKNIVAELKARADKTGDVRAAQFVAGAYEKGLGVNKDMNTAYTYYGIVADKTNNLDLQKKIALYYLNNHEVSESMKWFQKLADAGDALGQYYYGKNVFEGQGARADKEKGFTYMLQAAKQNFPQAQNIVGQCYLKGAGVQRNPDQAALWFNEAARRGEYEAQWNLAQLYVAGEGVHKNYPEALHWMQVCAPYGYDKHFQENCTTVWAGTEFYTFLQAQKAYEQNKNFDRAAKLFKQLDGEKVFGAKRMLALCYANSENPKRDMKKAISLLKDATKTDPYATYYLATFYKTGVKNKNGKVLVEQNQPEAVRLFREAANRGCGLADSQLGDAYFEGNGVVMSQNDAVRHYIEAEKQYRLTQTARKRLSDCYTNAWGGLREDKIEAARLSKPLRTMQLLQYVKQ
ncbi:MAG: sel1 repeat family protein [Alloprevotella sp.]|nr:sel1 repeat family protein [Alloprevotella sp.]